jgi:prevent-host-death family protein
MPMIRPSADLRNRYLEISEYCHNNGQPVFITRNGSGDLAVMSIELYEQLTSRQDLYAAVEK